jgi:DNA-binding MarR family transcriptional regulator
VLELHMTDAGREALTTARERVEPVERRVLDALSADEQAALATLLGKWIDAFEAS